MDPYIQTFTVNSIKTENVGSAQEARSILQINNNFSNFKLIHFNIRSVLKNFQELEIFLHQFDSKFDCIILTETWQVPNLNLIHLNDYSLLYNKADFNQNDGTIIYIRNDIDITEYSYTKIGDVSVIKLVFNKNNKSFSIHAMYRPPSSNLIEYIDSLPTYLQNHKPNSDYNIIVGDINIDILKVNLHTEEYLNIMAEFGFKSIINIYTRIQGSSQSCVDHIFVKSKFDIDDVILPIIIQTNITDHFPVLFQLVTESEQQSQQYHKNIKKYILYDKLKEHLSSADWSEVFQSWDVESATKTFLNIIENKLNICTKVVKIKKNMRKRKCWITNGIIKSIEMRDKLYRQVQAEPLNENLKTHYLNYRNKLTALIKKSKIKYFKSKIDKNKTCTKNLWSVVKEICNSNNSQNNITKIRNEENSIVTDTLEICNIFNNIYSNIGKNMAAKIYRNNNYKEQKIKTNGNSMFLAPTNPIEVRNCILKLKPNRAPGIDGIKSITLKNIADEISEIFAFIINRMFETGYYPMVFKISVVKPLFKSGDKMLVTNYRPISLITGFAKVVEMLLKLRLCNFLRKYDILSDKQFGFIEGKSTQDAIAELTKKIYHSLDKNKPSLCIFLDLAKAFDSVSHSHLLDCLEDIGIRNTVLDIFRSYLNNRKQCVDIGGTRSEFRKVSFGVPQGTVLGPVLFLIYMNNIFSLKSEGHIISFADDTAIYYEAETWPELKTKAENDLPNILEWLKFKLLTLNMEKTMFVPFGLYKNSIPNLDTLTVRSENELLQVKGTNNIKYLGIYIDCHLRWDVHINYVVKKLRKLVYMFKYIREILNTNNLIILYKSLVESHLTYGIIGWGGILNVHLKRLEIIQKRILKIILHKQITYPSEQLFEELHVFDIRQLYFYALALKTFSEKRDKITHKHHTRIKNQMNLPTVLMRTTTGQRSHSYLGPKVFNSIPKIVRDENSSHKFKNKLRKFILNSRVLTHTLIDSTNN